MIVMNVSVSIPFGCMLTMAMAHYCEALLPSAMEHTGIYPIECEPIEVDPINVGIASKPQFLSECCLITMLFTWSEFTVKLQPHQLLVAQWTSTQLCKKC